jgi:hypothetical protein
MGKLLEELNRRKVFRASAIYAVIAWGLIQVADTIAPMMNLPESAPRLVLFLLIILFPAAVFLAWAYEVTPEGIKPDFTAQSVPSTTNNTDRKLIYAIFGLVLLVAGFQLSDRFIAGNGVSSNRSTESASINASTSVMRTSIILDHLLAGRIGLPTIVDIAPDGSSLAYANILEGNWMLRNLATEETRVLEGASYGKAKFSPNGQMVLLGSSGVFGSLSIVVQSVQGGSIRPLPIQGGLSATWLSDEQIIYQHVDGDPRILSLEDLTETSIPDLNVAAGGGVAGHYVFNSLPSGSAFLYKEYPSGGLPGESIIQAYDLNSKSKTLVTSDGYFPQYVNSGHVLFLRAGELWAVPFDADSLSVTGAEARVVEEVAQLAPVWGAYSVSDSGRLVYAPSTGDVAGQTALYSTDRLGNQSEIFIPAGHFAEPRLSPNGELLALTSFKPDGSSEVWVYHFASGSFNPLTFSDNARTPVWTPDGSQIVYMQGGNGPAEMRPRGELWIRNANGTGQAERILKGPAKPDSFSPVDETLIYFVGGSESEAINLSTLTHSDDAWVSNPLLHTEHTTWGARISPDGRWIAYGSSESGMMQIYVQPYPNLNDGKWQISSEEMGTREPTWGPNGEELFYIAGSGSLMHVELTVQGDSIISSVPEPIFTSEWIPGSSPTYAISNDGESILHFGPSVDSNQITSIGSGRTELLVVENFFDELRRLAPADPQ